MRKQIKELRELTERLAEPGALQVVSNGETKLFGLYNGDDAAVVRVFVPAGVKFPWHTHAMPEHVVCVSGRAELVQDDGRKRQCKPRTVFTVPASEPHTFVAFEDTWLICVTIPPDEGYPDAR